MAMSFAIASALYHREKTGEGQMVSVSLWGSLLDAGALSLHAAIATGKDVPRKTRKDTNNPLCNNYEAKDGKWFQIASKQSDRNWPDLCKAIGRPELEKDPRFNSHAKRGDNCKELISILDKTFATKTLEEWKEILKGYNVHWSPVRTYLEISTHPQASANGYIVEAEHRQMGKIKVTGEPVYMSKTPPKIVAGAPEMGEHTEEILLDLGYGWEDIAGFKDKRVIL
jgi:formyl-CoA transferase